MKRIVRRSRAPRRVMRASIAVAGILAGCSGGGGGIFGPQESLNYTASSRVLITAPTRFEVSLAVLNPTSAPVTLSVSCLGILVYPTSARTGSPIYDSRTVQLCILAQETFQPAATKTYTATATTANVLGSSGTPGVYYLSVAMQFGNGTVILPAGQVDLKR
jgi:hypothetical protein